VEEIMVIRLEDYRKARAVKLPGYRRDEELLCVNWNPAFGLVAMTWYQTPQELSPQMPDDFEGIDIHAFMDRVHALASQI
jgi:hypothetical protein